MATWDCAKTTAARSVSILLLSRRTRNGEGHAELPEDEIGVAAARVYVDGTVGIVGDITLSQIRSGATIVVSRSKIEGANRFPERNHHPAAEHPRMRPVVEVGRVEGCSGVVRSRERRLGPEIRCRYRGVGVGPEPAVGNLELRTDGAEADTVVSFHIQRNAARIRKVDPQRFPSVLNTTHICADVEVALRVYLEHSGQIEPVAVRNVARELALWLRDCEIAPERKSRRQHRDVGYLCID